MFILISSILDSYVFFLQISRIRESSDKDRVMQRYKKLMILNHPDRGGSPFLAAKVNEAKEMLSRGK